MYIYIYKIKLNEREIPLPRSRYRYLWWNPPSDYGNLPTKCVRIRNVYCWPAIQSSKHHASGVTLTRPHSRPREVLPDRQ